MCRALQLRVPIFNRSPAQPTRAYHPSTAVRAEQAGECCEQWGQRKHKHIEKETFLEKLLPCPVSSMAPALG